MGWHADSREGWRDFQGRHPGAGTPDGNPGKKTLGVVLELEGHKAPTVAPTSYSYGGDEIRRGVRRDPSELLPWFADRVELVFQALRADGHDPLLWEALRSRERAQKLAKKGTGIVDSIHLYGGAVDIVDGSDSTPWTEVPEGFWAAVQRHAEANGLHVLHNRKGRRIDLPHVQCVAQGREQNRFRAATDAERAAWA